MKIQRLKMCFGPIVVVFGSMPQLISKDRTKALDQSSGPRTGYLRHGYLQTGQLSRHFFSDK